MSVPNTVMAQSQILFQGKWPRNSRHVFAVPYTVKSQTDERTEKRNGKRTSDVFVWQEKVMTCIELL